MDMCHFGLVGSGKPDPSNFRSSRVAAATLRPPLHPLVAGLNEYCTRNVPPWFTSCSIQIVRPQGIETMGLHAHLRDGAAVALILCMGSFRGGVLWLGSGGLLNSSLRGKKQHTRVCKGSETGGSACKGTQEAPVLFTTRSLHAPLPWEGE